MFEQLRDLNDTIAILTGDKHFALLIAVDVIEIFVLKLGIMNSTIVAHGPEVLVCIIIFSLNMGFEFGHFFIDDFLHAHQHHRVELLELLHHFLLAEGSSQKGYDSIDTILLFYIELLE